VAYAVPLALQMDCISEGDAARGRATSANAKTPGGAMTIMKISSRNLSSVRRRSLVKRPGQHRRQRPGAQLRAPNPRSWSWRISTPCGIGVSPSTGRRRSAQTPNGELDMQFFG
jgi:hypothetical protein